METYSDQVLILPWEGTEGAETPQPLEPGALASPLTYLRAPHTPTSEFEVPILSSSILRP